MVSASFGFRFYGDAVKMVPSVHRHEVSHFTASIRDIRWYWTDVSLRYCLGDVLAAL